ncbi:MAG: hypothetical protein HFJ55_01445 [Clostridia bacterium]|nr:hypothetical protein [Clostridia bacterium]
MSNKKIGFTIGKFAPLHKGHEKLIEKGVNETDEFYVVIYDTDVTNIPVQTRAKWITDKFKKAKVIYAYDSPKKFGLDEESVKIQMEYLTKQIKDIPVNCFYSNEPYGEKVAEYLNIENRMSDPTKKEIPISATLIRRDLERYKDFVEPNIYKDVYNANHGSTMGKE